MIFAELLASADTVENAMPQNSTISINGNERVLVEIKGAFYEIEKVFYDFKSDAVILKCQNTRNKT